MFACTNKKIKNQKVKNLFKVDMTKKELDDRFLLNSHKAGFIRITPSLESGRYLGNYQNLVRAQIIIKT